MPISLTQRYIFWLKAFIHILSLGLAVYQFYLATTDQLGGDPVEALLHFTGISALNLLLLSLIISPLSKKLKAGNLMKIRRLLGLYAFVYALLHFVSYLLFELQLAWQLLFSEIIKRPYITVGFVALLILMVLACTSTQTMQRKLGKKWQKLHNWVYLALLLGCLHYVWSVKSLGLQPIVYWLLTAVILFFRQYKLRKWLSVQK